MAHQGSISQCRKNVSTSHGAATILITGLSGAGKTTTAHELSRALFEREINSFVLDGQMRMGIES